jgi:hypothetical protein
MHDWVGVASDGFVGWWSSLKDRNEVDMILRPATDKSIKFNLRPFREVAVRRGILIALLSGVILLAFAALPPMLPGSTMVSLFGSAQAENLTAPQRRRPPSVQPANAKQMSRWVIVSGERSDVRKKQTGNTKAPKSKRLYLNPQPEPPGIIR